MPSTNLQAAVNARALISPCSRIDERVGDH